MFLESQVAPPLSALDGERQASNAIEVRTPGGILRGAIEGGLARYRGIRYARAERFKPPVSEPPWEGVRDALTEGPVCPQPGFELDFLVTPKALPPMSEDCLFLNVTAPVEADGPLPVLVWVHGGGYVNGSGGGEIFDPARLARDGGAVLVGVNFRLGAFGFLPLPGIAPANLGLQDLLCALDWVRSNIASFGGDSAHVTLLGQSAGAHAIVQLLAVEEADDLFSRVILQSPPLGLDGSRRTLSESLAALFLDDLDSPCSATPDQIVRSQTVAAQRLRGNLLTKKGMPFAPVPGEWPLPPEEVIARRVDARSRHIDMIIGHTKDEAHPFVDVVAFLRRARASRLTRPLFHIVSHVITRRVFRNPVRRFAERVSDAGGRVFLYRFDRRPKHTPWGACHSVDLPFLWATEQFWAGAPMLGGADWRDLETFGRGLRHALGVFARTGRPDPLGWADAWQPFSRDLPRLLRMQLDPDYTTA